MAYYDQELLKAINDRLSADATLTALLTDAAGSIFSVEISSKAAPPYLVLDIVGEEASGGFDTLGRRLRVEVAIYVPRRYTTAVPSERRTAIVGRVDGNWSKQANRTPTYGLDRFRPVLDSWDCSPLRFTGAASLIDAKENLILAGRQFECIVSELIPAN